MEVLDEVLNAFFGDGFGVIFEHGDVRGCGVCWLGRFLLLVELFVGNAVCKFVVPFIHYFWLLELLEDFSADEDVLFEKQAYDFLSFYEEFHGSPSSSNSSVLMRSVMVWLVLMLISRVRPYLPLLMTFAMMMPSMSSSAMMSLIRRWVSGRNPVCLQFCS